MTFGDYVKKVREKKAEKDKQFSLRQFSARIKISPAYLSRLENEKDLIPSEEIIIKIAKGLGENEDVLLAMNGKVSSRLQEIILKRPKLFDQIITSLESVPDHAALKIIREVRDGKW